MLLITLRRLAFPCLLLFVALFLREPSTNIDPAYQTLLVKLPYITLGVALIFSVYYNRCRHFTTALTMLLAYFLIQVYLQTSLSDPEALFLYTMIGISLPITYLFLLFINEKGIYNRYGLLTLAIIPSLIAIAVFIYKTYHQTEILLAIDNYLAIRPVPWFVLSINASLFFLLITVIGLYRLVKYQDDFIVPLLSEMV